MELHLNVLNVTKASYSSQSVMLEVLLPDNVYQLHIVIENVISIVNVVKKLLLPLVPLVTKDSYLSQIMTEL